MAQDDSGISTFEFLNSGTVSRLKSHLTGRRSCLSYAPSAQARSHHSCCMFVVFEEGRRRNAGQSMPIHACLFIGLVVTSKTVMQAKT